MRAKAIGVVVAALVLGLLGGGVLAFATRPGSASADRPAPVPGSNPSYPDAPDRGFHVQADIDAPAMPATANDYSDGFHQETLVTADRTWHYVKPTGWTDYCITGKTDGVTITDDQLTTCNEVRYRPAGEPLIGGYSLRVKGIAGDRMTAQDEVARQLADLRQQVADKQGGDLMVLNRDDDSLRVSILTRLSEPAGTQATYLRRYNFFRWYTAPGDTYASLEMSVTGRAVDAPGLAGLLRFFTLQAMAVT